MKSDPSPNEQWLLKGMLAEPRTLVEILDAARQANPEKKPEMSGVHQLVKRLIAKGLVSRSGRHGQRLYQRIDPPVVSNAAPDIPLLWPTYSELMALNGLQATPGATGVPLGEQLKRKRLVKRTKYGWSLTLLGRHCLMVGMWLLEQVNKDL